MTNHGQITMLHIRHVTRREIRQCPNDHARPDNHCRYLLQIIGYTLPDVQSRITQGRTAIGWQFAHVIVLRLTERLRLLHDPCKQYTQHHTQYIQRHHHQRFLLCKECSYKQHIHWQTSRTTHEWHHQHRQCTIFLIGNVFCCHDGRHITSKTHQHRDKRTAVQTDSVHPFIHRICHTRHVARVLHQTQKEEHDDDIRQECQYRTYTQ